MLLKGFVGTGILFMGKAFFNGGIVFSTIVLLAIAMISLWSFLLLTKTYLVVPGSFGDIGGALYGNYMRLTILASIAFSQIGFVAGECTRWFLRRRVDELTSQRTPSSSPRTCRRSCWR
jgi:proton-coupled amino acid transporter